VGGRFKLSTLIQKRLIALQQRRSTRVGRAATGCRSSCKEILQDKIFLDPSGNVQTRNTAVGDAARRAMLSANFATREETFNQQSGIRSQQSVSV